MNIKVIIFFACLVLQLFDANACNRGEGKGTGKSKRSTGQRIEQQSQQQRNQEKGTENSKGLTGQRTEQPSQPQCDQEKVTEKSKGPTEQRTVQQSQHQRQSEQQNRQQSGHPSHRKPLNRPPIQEIGMMWYTGGPEEETRTAAGIQFSQELHTNYYNTPPGGFAVEVDRFKESMEPDQGSGQGPGLGQSSDPGPSQVWAHLEDAQRDVIKQTTYYIATQNGKEEMQGTKRNSKGQSGRVQ